MFSHQALWLAVLFFKLLQPTQGHSEEPRPEYFFFHL